MSQTNRALTLCLFVVALSPITAKARPPLVVPGYYAISVDERCEQDPDEGAGSFLLRLSIQAFNDRRSMADGAVRLPFVAFGEPYFLVLRGRHAQINYLDGYTAPARVMVSYPRDLRSARLFRGTTFDIDENEISADGALEMSLDVAFLPPHA